MPQGEVKRDLTAAFSSYVAGHRRRPAVGLPCRGGPRGRPLRTWAFSQNRRGGPRGRPCCFQSTEACLRFLKSDCKQSHCKWQCDDFQFMLFHLGLTPEAPAAAWFLATLPPRADAGSSIGGDLLAAARLPYNRFKAQAYASRPLERASGAGSRLLGVCVSGRKSVRQVRFDAPSPSQFRTRSWPPRAKS